MSPSLPVPSPGALRVLRHIALGTSCTVAVGAGLITEDRRRRIHAAREVNNNAHRLKASRKYHSAGVETVRNFEEQVINFGEYRPFRDAETINSLDSQREDFLPDDASQGKMPSRREGLTRERNVASIDEQLNLLQDLSTVVQVPRARHASVAPTSRQNAMDFKDNRQVPMAKIGFHRPVEKAKPRISYRPLLDANTNTHFEDNRQELREIDPRLELLSDISTMLKRASSIEHIQVAARLLEDEISCRTSENVLSQELIDTCLDVFYACDTHHRIYIYAPILQKILALGPIEAKLFYGLKSLETMQLLLRHANTTEVTDIRLLKVKQAAEIFLAEIAPKHSLPKVMLFFAEQLGEETLRAGYYSTTEAIFQRISTDSESKSSISVRQAILANVRQGDVKKGLHYFRNFFPSTGPLQVHFSEVTDALFDICLARNWLNSAEEVIRIATEMVQATDRQLRISWYLKDQCRSLLRQHWRTMRDIASTQALFQRLTPFLDCVGQPQKFYSAMFQLCVQAGKRAEGDVYLQKLGPLTGANKVDIRTCGNVALSQAMENNWEGVQKTLKIISKCPEHFQEDVSASFLPSFKLFAKSHSVSATEQFLISFIEKNGLVPTSYISNVMINKYAQDGEVARIPAWLKYMEKFNVFMDSWTFNILLTTCRDEHNFCFEQLWSLCQKFRTMSSNTIDQMTAEILQQAAIKIAKQNPDVLRRYLSMVKTLRSGLHRDSSFHVSTMMREKIATGRPDKASKIYERAQRSLASAPTVLATAVEAANECAKGDGFEASIALLKKADDAGRDITYALTPIMMRQLTIKCSYGGDIRKPILSVINDFKKHGFKPSLSVATKAVGLLNDAGYFQEAIGLWEDLCCANNSNLVVDTKCLTVLMRSYIALMNFGGIEWVINTLEQKQIKPDEHLKLLLKNAFSRANKAVKANSENELMKDFRDVLGRSYRFVIIKMKESAQKKAEAEKTTLEIMGMAAKAHQIEGKEIGCVMETEVQTETSPVYSDCKCLDEAKGKDANEKELDLYPDSLESGCVPESLVM
jgi:hypothetical protein